MTSKISLAFVLLLAGCSTLPKANPRAEITSVLAQRQELKESYLKPDKKYPYRKPEYSKYVPEIKHLDVSRCPADFQQAVLTHGKMLPKAGLIRASLPHD